MLALLYSLLERLPSSSTTTRMNRLRRDPPSTGPSSVSVLLWISQGPERSA